MFDMQNGWLRFRPFKWYQLPELKELEPNANAPFHRHGAGEEPSFVRKQWVLRWPGTLTRRRLITIPCEVISRWPSCQGMGYLEGGFPIEELIRGDRIPKKHTPESIAYFLAVNHKMYHKNGVQYDVAGMPAKAVQKVVDAVFAFDQVALDTLKYLKWLAEVHRSFPLFQGFDTNVREQLTGVARKAAQLFFYLAFDYVYDPEAKWYVRNLKGYDRCAAYLHWVGRTGQGIYRSHAELDPRYDATLDNRWPEMQYIFRSLDNWDLWKMRQYQHENGAESEVEEGEDKS